MLFYIHLEVKREFNTFQLGKIKLYFRPFRVFCFKYFFIIYQIKSITINIAHLNTVFIICGFKTKPTGNPFKQNLCKRVVAIFYEFSIKFSSTLNLGSHRCIGTFPPLQSTLQRIELVILKLVGMKLVGKLSTVFKHVNVPRTDNKTQKPPLVKLKK